MVALQTDSGWNHIRGFGCSLSVDISMGLVPYGCFDVEADTVERIVRAAIKQGLIKDNDAPIDLEHPERWFRVEVQGSEPWIRFASSQIGYPAVAKRLGKIITTSTLLNPPAGCNAVKLEYQHGPYTHFVEAFPIKGEAKVKYNPDPKITLGPLISVRYWQINRA
jgi:hypothetical protein